MDKGIVAIYLTLIIISIIAISVIFGSVIAQNNAEQIIKDNGFLVPIGIMDFPVVLEKVDDLDVFMNLARSHNITKIYNTYRRFVIVIDEVIGYYYVPK